MPKDSIQNEVNDYKIHLSGSLTNRASKIAFNNLLLDMDNYIILSSIESK